MNLDAPPQAVAKHRFLPSLAQNVTRPRRKWKLVQLYFTFDLDFWCALSISDSQGCFMLNTPLHAHALNEHSGTWTNSTLPLVANTFLLRNDLLYNASTVWNHTHKHQYNTRTMNQLKYRHHVLNTFIWLHFKLDGTLLLIIQTWIHEWLSQYLKFHLLRSVQTCIQPHGGESALFQPFNHLFNTVNGQQFIRYCEASFISSARLLHV